MFYIRIESVMKVSNDVFFETIIIIINQLLLFIAATVDKIFKIVSFKNFK